MGKDEMRPAAKLMGIDEMETAIAERATHDKRIFYKQQANDERRAEMKRDLGMRRMMLQNVERCDLTDLAEVKTRTFMYLTACENAGSFPTVMGLSALGLGITRRRLNEFMQRHPASETTVFLESVKEMLADILSNAALSRQCDPVSAIFQLKNQHSFTDRVEITPAPTDLLGDPVDAQALAEKYADMPD